jgi:hypothetical protein
MRLKLAKPDGFAITLLYIKALELHSRVIKDSKEKNEQGAIQRPSDKE